MKVKIGDNVLIISGKDKGKTGKVMKTFKKAEKLIVEKINVRIKHIKKTQTRPGEKIQFEAPITASNAMIVCPHCKKAVRVSYKQEENGKKERVCKKCQQSMDTIQKISHKKK